MAEPLREGDTFMIVGRRSRDTWRPHDFWHLIWPNGETWTVRPTPTWADLLAFAETNKERGRE